MVLEAEPGAGELLDLESLYRDHASRLRRLIRRQVPAHLVDDALHDTFLRVHASRHRVDPQRPLWPWLATLAYRACHEAKRRERLHLRAAVDAAANTSLEPHDEIERAERAHTVNRAWAQLLPRQQWLLYQRLVAGASYDLLAAEDGASGEALRMAVHRARRVFRTRYRALAKRSELLTGAGIGLERLRTRLSRAAVWATSSSWVEAPFVVLAGAGVVVAMASMGPPPTAQVGHVQVATLSPSAIANAPTRPRGLDPSPATSQPSTAVVHPKERAPLAAAGTRTPVGSTLDASGSGVDLGPHDSIVTIELKFEDPGGQQHHHTQVPVYCDRTTTGALVCNAWRTTPAPR